MGFVLSKLVDEWLGVEKIHILMLGLKTAGKTTILEKLNLGNVTQCTPTIGFNVETVEYQNIIQITVWDLGASQKIKQLQKYYFQDIQALTFVIDSIDIDSMQLINQELQELLKEKDLKACPLLILANKQDKAIMSVAQIIEHLQLQQLDRDWFIQSTCALTGEGLQEGFDWLARTLKKKNE